MSVDRSALARPPTLLYLHGFLSSPASHKAQVTQAWLKQHKPDWRYLCPALSSYPDEAWAKLVRLIEHELTAPIYLIGSSLGGFWATCLAERYGHRAVLINPAVHPQTRFCHLVGQTLQSYYSDASYQFEPRHLECLEQLDPERLTRPERYWLLVQTADETLDYRQGVDRYAGCRQTVEEGGSHAFDNYQAHLPAIIEFFERSA